MAHAVRDIRRRIKAVRSTQQITKAMQMVAAARLRKAQSRALSARAYAAKLDELLGRLVADGAHAGHPLLAARRVRRVTVLLITADRGLSGSYNTNLFRKAEAVLAELKRSHAARDSATGKGNEPLKIDLLVVGRKGRDYFRRRGWAIAREEIGVHDDDLADLARDVSIGFVDRFCRAATDEVIVIYSKFLNALQQRPTEMRLLPVVTPDAGGEGAGVGGMGEACDRVAGAEGEDVLEGDDQGESPAARRRAARRAGEAEKTEDLRYVYEPSAQAVHSLLLPKYVSNQLFQAFLESRAAGYAAQMTAMAAATDNANDLISRLTLDMHHARQGSITQEIMELVGGAEALKER